MLGVHSNQKLCSWQIYTYYPNRLCADLLPDTGKNYPVKREKKTAHERRIIFKLVRGLDGCKMGASPADTIRQTYQTNEETTEGARDTREKQR